MAKLRSYDFRCVQCRVLLEAAGWPELPSDRYDVDFDEIVEIDDAGTHPVPPCPACGKADHVVRVPSAPRVLKESWPDGRKRPDSWYIAKEAARLRKESFRLPPKKRGELAQEAKRLDGEASKRYKEDT